MNTPSPLGTAVVADNTDPRYRAARDAIITLLDGVEAVKDLADGITGTDAKIGANPAPYIRLVAAEIVKIERAMIALARQVSGPMESATTK